MGNITDAYGIEVETYAGRTTGHEIYKTDDVRQVTVQAETGASAGTKICFGKAGGVYCLALGCTYQYISNMRDLEQAMVGLLEKDKWNADHAIVTHLIRARSTTILISAGSQASIVLHAAGRPIDPVALSKLNTAIFTAKKLQLRYSLFRSLGKGMKGLLSKPVTPHIAELQISDEPEATSLGVSATGGESERTRPTIRDRYYQSLEE